MQLTIIRDDNAVYINGEFKTVDLSNLLSSSISAVQWDGESGHIEFYYPGSPNQEITGIDQFSAIIDAFNVLPSEPIPEIPAAQRIAEAHARINTAYEMAVNEVTAGYPETEIASWPKQETEARAWLADNATVTPWIDAAADARAMPKYDFVNLIIANANALAPIHGFLTGRRQYLRDQIDAMGEDPMQEQLDAIQWG